MWLRSEASRQDCEGRLNVLYASLLQNLGWRLDTILLLLNRRRSRTHDGNLMVLHAPNLVADRSQEVLVVADDDDAAAEVPQGPAQGGNRLEVKEVGRLVQAHHMRLRPEGSGEHEFGLLASGITADGMPLDEVLGKAEALEVLHDLPRRQRPLDKAGLQACQALVQRSGHTLDAELPQLGHGLEGILLLVKPPPLHLIPIFVLPLRPRYERLDSLAVLSVPCRQGI
mmetsp:Transcript_95061/g.273646  ORF Transcript_95061/g.273646 Transcript_95061/m.273646 type:complete len:227 (-) Transcript_95061:1696-2376(-)